MWTLGEEAGRETVAVGLSLDGRYAGPRLSAGEAARSGSSSLPREFGEAGVAKVVPAATPEALDREARSAGEEVMLTRCRCREGFTMESPQAWLVCSSRASSFGTAIRREG
jgi:hypothetical protein